MKKFDTSIYFITDSSYYEESEFLRRVSLALQGGVTLLQLREKELSTREYITLAEKVLNIARQNGIPLIIDDRVDVALAVGAAGVHLGQADMSVKTARRILGEDFIIGATAKTVEQALTAYGEGADYLGVGAIFPTKTKVKTVLTSVETLTDICKAVPIPVNAIGGLNHSNLDVLKGVGVDGVCAVSSIMTADDPAEAARGLKDAFSALNRGEKR